MTDRLRLPRTMTARQVRREYLSLLAILDHQTTIAFALGDRPALLNDVVRTQAMIRARMDQLFATGAISTIP